MKKINKSFLYKFSSLCIALGGFIFIMDLVCCSLENQNSKKNKDHKTTSETYLVSIVVFLSKE